MPIVEVTTISPTTAATCAGRGETAAPPGGGVPVRVGARCRVTVGRRQRPGGCVVHTGAEHGRRHLLVAKRTVAAVRVSGGDLVVVMCGPG